MKKIFVSILAVLTVVACSKEGDFVPETSPLTVSFDGGMTAAEADEISRAGYDGVKSIWHAGDAVGVTFDANNSNLQFTQVPGSLSADGTRGKFTGTLNTPITGNVEGVAYYPYAAGASVSGEIITTTFPAMQTYLQNAYGGIPLFGNYAGDISAVHMQFKNLFSVIKLTLTKAPAESQSVKLQSIVFRGNNSETVSGTMSVDMSGATPVVSYTGTGKNITLDCGAGVELTSTPQTFYIAVPAITYSQGFTFTFKTDKGQVVKSVKSAGATYAANKIYNTPPLALNNFLVAVTISDLNLRNLLSTLGLVHILDPLEGTVSITAAGLAVATIDVSGGSISSLVGIENFPALVTLNCSNNQLTTLDVSHNPLLAHLNCSGNQLTTLDVSSNPALLILNCSHSQLTSLNLGTSILMTDLNCSSNMLPSLSVSSKTALLTLDCSTNQLTSLDLKANIALTSVKCYGNTLMTLDISGLRLLGTLYLNSTTNSIALLKLTIPANATIQNFIADNFILNALWTAFTCTGNPTIKTISLKGDILLLSAAATNNPALTKLDITGTLPTLFPVHSGNAVGFQVVR